MTVGAGVQAEFDRLNNLNHDYERFVAAFDAWWGVRIRDFFGKHENEKSLRLEMMRVRREMATVNSMSVTAIGFVKMANTIADQNAEIAACEEVRKSLVRTIDGLKLQVEDLTIHGACVSTDDGKCLIQKSIEALGDPRVSVTLGPVKDHSCGGQMACPEPTCPEYAR